MRRDPGFEQAKSLPKGPSRKEAARRRYLRKLDRQRRANNPGNYREDGTLRPKAQRQPWRSSARHGTTRGELQELLRAMAAQRKSLQGEVVHQVLALGNNVITEKVDKQSWAKLWGRSIGHKAPGVFETRLGIVARAVGGGLEQVSTRTTYLSSRCICGKRVKKGLSERKHTCGCEFIPEGVFADRDEFSAFLAFHCQGSVLDEVAARESWQAWGADCLLRPLASDKEAANGEAMPSLRGQRPRRSGSVVNEAGQWREALPLATGGNGERRDRKVPKPRKPNLKREAIHVA